MIIWRSIRVRDRGNSCLADIRAAIEREPAISAKIDDLTAQESATRELGTVSRLARLDRLIGPEFSATTLAARPKHDPTLASVANAIFGGVVLASTWTQQIATRNQARTARGETGGPSRAMPALLPFELASQCSSGIAGQPRGVLGLVGQAAQRGFHGLWTETVQIRHTTPDKQIR